MVDSIKYESSSNLSQRAHSPVTHFIRDFCISLLGIVLHLSIFVISFIWCFSII